MHTSHLFCFYSRATKLNRTMPVAASAPLFWGAELEVGGASAPLEGGSDGGGGLVGAGEDDGVDDGMNDAVGA